MTTNISTLESWISIIMRWIICKWRYKIIDNLFFLGTIIVGMRFELRISKYGPINYGWSKFTLAILYYRIYIFSSYNVFVIIKGVLHIEMSMGRGVVGMSFPIPFLLRISFPASKKFLRDFTARNLQENFVHYYYYLKKKPINLNH